MKAVNLLPADRRGSRRGSPIAIVRRQPLPFIAVAVSVVVVAGLGLEIRSAASTVSAHQQTLRELDAQLAALPAPPTAPAVKTTADRANVVTTVAGQRTTWDGFLSSLSRVIPEDVWLISLSANATGGAAVPGTTTAPTAFTITGFTYSQPSVARLMRRLRLVPWLNDVSLTSSSKTALNNHTVYQFTLGANVTPLPEVKS